jgi:hypothetical protein
MTLIVRLIQKYALWIYALCGLGMLLYLRSALAARNEGSQAMFSLEREQAAKRVYRSSGMILVLLLIVIGVYTLSNYVELSDTRVEATPTATLPQETPPTVQRTRRATQQPSDNASDAATPTGEPTPTRRPRVTSVVIPTPVLDTPVPQVVPAPCPHPNVQVLQPGQNQVIDAGIEVRGVATKEGFDRYEFKFTNRDLPGDEWHWVETYRDPVPGGRLGFWSTAHLPPGNYRFMLIVIDSSGNSQECVVPVVIQR